MSKQVSSIQLDSVRESRRISFSREPIVILYQAPPPTETQTINEVFTQPRVEDPLTKERRTQQLIAKKVILSYQRRLRHCDEASSLLQLAEMSCKFSRRARDQALETARLAYIEAYGDASDGNRPRFSPKGDSLISDVNVPFELNVFPSVKLLPKVSFDNDEEMARAKRQRIKA